MSWTLLYHMPGLVNRLEQCSLELKVVCKLRSEELKTASSISKLGLEHETESSVSKLHSELETVSSAAKLFQKIQLLSDELETGSNVPKYVQKNLKLKVVCAKLCSHQQ